MLSLYYSSKHLMTVLIGNSNIDMLSEIDALEHCNMVNS